MNLLAFRQLFRTLTGRYDLVNEDGSDNGANFFINAGQKYLDRAVDIPQTLGRVFKDIIAGQFLVTFQNSRSILEVWCIGDNGTGTFDRLPLRKYPMNELRGVDSKTLEQYYTGMFSDIDQSRPLYYSPALLKLQTDSVGGSGGVGGFMDVMTEGHQSYNGIVFLPPSDREYTIEVLGNFYSLEMSADTDHTYWTDVHPNLLIQATMREVEIMHRNREGVADWTSAVHEGLVGIDMDGVAEGSVDATEMEG